MSLHESAGGDFKVAKLSPNLFTTRSNNDYQIFGLTHGTEIVGTWEIATHWMPCNPNTTYTISKPYGKIFQIFTTELEPAIGVATSPRQIANSATSITHVTSASANYLCITYNNLATDIMHWSHMVLAIQVEYGTEATEFQLPGLVSFEHRPVKYWDGTEWKIKRVKVWTGTEWVLTHRSSEPI